MSGKSDLKWLIELGREQKSPHELLLDRCDKELARYQAIEEAARRYKFWVEKWLETRVGTSPLVMMDAEKAAEKASNELAAALEKK